jgi:hypothetical protein
LKKIETEKFSLKEFAKEFELIKNTPKNPKRNKTIDIITIIDI